MILHIHENSIKLSFWQLNTTVFIKRAGICRIPWWIVEEQWNCAQLTGSRKTTCDPTTQQCYFFQKSPKSVLNSVWYREISLRFSFEKWIRSRKTGLQILAMAAMFARDFVSRERSSCRPVHMRMKRYCLVVLKYHKKKFRKSRISAGEIPKRLRQD